MSVEIGSRYRLEQSLGKRLGDENLPDAGSFTSGPIAVPTHCFVSGALALVLRMSRIVGIAPLDFERQDSGTWIIRVSKTKHIYSVVLITALSIVALTASSLDLIIGRDYSVFMRASTKSIGMLLLIMTLILTANINTLTAPALMKAMIGFLSHLNKINSDMNNSVPHIENRLKMMVVSVVSFFAIVYGCDIYTLITFALNKNLNVIVAFLKVTGYILVFNQDLINLQFSFSVLPIYSTLKAINDHLDRLCHTIKNEGLHNIKYDAVIEKNEISSDTNTIPLKSVNVVIDRMTSKTGCMSEPQNNN